MVSQITATLQSIKWRSIPHLQTLVSFQILALEGEFPSGPCPLSFEKIDQLFGLILLSVLACFFVYQSLFFSSAYTDHREFLAHELCVWGL